MLNWTESILVFALCLPLIRNEIPMGTGFLSFTVASSSLAHCSTVVPFGNLADKPYKNKVMIEKRSDLGGGPPQIPSIFYLDLIFIEFVR